MYKNHKETWCFIKLTLKKIKENLNNKHTIKRTEGREAEAQR